MNGTLHFGVINNSKGMLVNIWFTYHDPQLRFSQLYVVSDNLIFLDINEE